MYPNFRIETDSLYTFVQTWGSLRIGQKKLTGSEVKVGCLACHSRAGMKIKAAIQDKKISCF